MTRRIVLISIIVIVVLGAAFGAWRLLGRRFGPERLLAKSELAARAGKFDRSLDMARRYVEKKPEDWRGHYAEGLAQAHLARYADARAAFEEAIRREPAEAAYLGLAGTYAGPAREALRRPATARQVRALTDAIAALQQANQVLAEARLKEGASRLGLDEAIGLDLIQIGSAQQVLSSRLAEEAATAEAAMDEATRDEKQKASREAAARADETLQQAAQTLLEVVRAAPSRAEAAEALVRLCVGRGDQATLAAAREAILSAGDVSPAAVALLIAEDLRKAGTPDAQRLADAAARLDDLVKKHPETMEAKLLSAEVALQQGDFAKVEAIVDQVLKDVPKQREARFLRARLRIRQARWGEAERELYALKNEFPGWVEANFLYGGTAREAGRSELAREAMLAVIRLDPKHAGAHHYLARDRMDAGLFEQAFEHAQVSYDQRPNDPAVLRVYVDAAARAGRPEAARQALDRALAAQPPDPERLMAVADGFASLSDDPKALEAARRAAEAGATSTAAVLAVARAKVALRQVAEAEQLLTEELKAHPDDARVHFELGRLLSGTGRHIQAVEHLRAATRLAEPNADYALALARSLLGAGLVGDAESVCQDVLRQDPSNSAALLLVGQIRVAKGDITFDEMVHQVDPKRQRGLPLALAYLNHGEPERCRDLCLEELEKSPDNRDAVLLLGQAYLALGKKAECIEQWAQLVRKEPGDLLGYVRLAGVLGRDLAPEEVERRLLEVPTAARDLVDVAMGWLHDRSGRHEMAAEAYGRVADRAAAPLDSRNRARILRSASLARAGHAHRAILELDRISGEGLWPRQAAYAKASLLVAAKQPAEAKTVLESLGRTAVAGKDTGLVRGIAGLYAQLNEPDEALRMCDELDRLLPKDPRRHLVRAGVLTAVGRRAEAVACYRNAIAEFPGDFSVHVTLARQLDALGRPVEALQALDALEALGEAGQVEARFERGAMFSRWGLQSKAIECAEDLSRLGYVRAPRLQVILGRAFAAFGQKDRARDLLRQVPAYSGQYMAAQQLLVELTDGADGQLRLLRELKEARPGQASILTQEMDVLLRAQRPAEAAKAFQEFVDEHAREAPLPVSVYRTAVRAMVDAGDLKGARDLSGRLARQTSGQGWEYMDALLTSAIEPEEALKRLPEPGAAEAPALLLGLCLGPVPAEVLQQRYARLRRLIEAGGAAGAPPPPPAGPRILAALVCGDVRSAEAELERLPAGANITREAAAELAAHAKADSPSAAREAARLLRASLAADMALATLARAWAMEALQARPTCQWAAALAAATGADAAARRRVLEVLKPRDCLAGRLIEADICMDEKHYDKAAALLQDALQRDTGNPRLVLNLAVATERAGRLAEALQMYRQAWEASKNPIAANNAAYLVTQLHPDDAALLAEAATWVQAAVDAAPDVAAFRDTLGWVAYLRGRHEEACVELRRAVKGLPNTPEVHYHLGAAEAAAGRPELARWHLTAAVDLGQGLAAKGEPLPKTTAEAVERARRELAKLKAPAT